MTETLILSDVLDLNAAEPLKAELLALRCLLYTSPSPRD